MISDVLSESGLAVLEYLREDPQDYPPDCPVNTLIREALAAMERARIALDAYPTIVPNTLDGLRRYVQDIQDGGFVCMISVTVCRDKTHGRWKRVEEYRSYDPTAVPPCEVIASLTRKEAISLWQKRMGWYQEMIDHPHTNSQDFHPLRIEMIAGTETAEPKFTVAVVWKSKARG